MSAPSSSNSTTDAALVAQVADVERAFARTMQERDFNRFVSFLSPEAAFFNGRSVAHGRGEIAAVWQPYFRTHDAPFSWQPDHVEVLPSGTLALSTGPVIQQGNVVGRFDSIWRLEAPHTWRIVFDKGEAVCGAPPRP